MTEPIKTNADLIAEAVRLTFDSMSRTDQRAIQSAILRAQRKAISAQMRDLRGQQ